MIIEAIKEPDEDLLRGLNRLVPQLKASSLLVSRENVIKMLSSNSVKLFVARSIKGEIIGMLTLIIYPVPTGIRARIEDVVVDESFRRRGIAQELIKFSLEVARMEGVDGIALTSNPSRYGANELYKKIGFVLWKTNVYLYKFNEQDNKGDSHQAISME